MHLDDTPIKVLTEIIVLGKLLKDIVWSKPARRIGRYLSKKTHIFSVQRLFLKKSESRRHGSLGIRFFKKSYFAPRLKQMLFQKSRNRLTTGSGTYGSAVFKALAEMHVAVVGLTAVDADHIQSSNLNRLIN